MNKIGIEIIKGLTNLLVELDKKEEARTEKEERRHKELLEALGNLRKKEMILVPGGKTETIHSKIEEKKEEKKEIKQKTKKEEVEMVNLFENKKEEQKQEEQQLSMEQLKEKIEEAGRKDKEEGVIPLNFENENGEEDPITDKLGADSNETFAIIPEEILEENQKDLEEMIGTMEEHKEMVEEETTVVEEEIEVPETIEETMEEDEGNDMLTLLNNISDRIKIDEEQEETKEEKTEVPETVETAEEEKEDTTKLLEEIHSFPRLLNDYPIVDEEILKAILNPEMKLALTKKIIAKKIAERLEEERATKVNAEEEKIEEEAKGTLESLNNLTKDIKDIDMNTKEVIRVEGENLTKEEKESIESMLNNKTTNPIIQFGFIKLLEDDTITVAGETLYRIEYMKDIMNKGAVLIASGDKTGYASPDSVIGGKVCIGKNARLLAGAIIEPNTALLGDEEMIVPRGTMIKSKTIIKTQEDVINKGVKGKEFKIID